MRVLLFTSTLAFVNLRPTSSQAIVTANLLAHGFQRLLQTPQSWPISTPLRPSLSDLLLHLRNDLLNACASNMSAPWLKE